ncbi:Extracellular calcium-sensing receptor, partial [Varanus komodoensis]
TLVAGDKSVLSGEKFHGSVIGPSSTIGVIDIESHSEIGLLTKNYQHILALIFAVKEINESNQILPNVSLGFIIYDSYGGRWTYHATMELSATLKKFMPNYTCGIPNHLKSVIGALYSQTSLDIADILSTYKVPQLTYGSPPETSDQTETWSFYQMVPNETHEHWGIIQLLDHFRWMWVGILVKENIGERFGRIISSMFPTHGICVAFLERIKPFYLSSIFDDLGQLIETYSVSMNSNANTVIVYENNILFLRLLLYLPKMEMMLMEPKGKVWIMTVKMELTSYFYQRTWDIQVIHGALSFAVHSHEVPGFKTFLQTRHHFFTKEDGFVKDFWEQAFDCIFPNPLVSEKVENVCSGTETLESLPGAFFEMSMTGHSYNVYNAVHVVARALHAFQSGPIKHQANVNGWRQNLQHQQPWQLHHFLKSVTFNNSAGDEISFDQNGVLLTGFDIINWVTFPNQSFHRVKVGKLDPQAPVGKMFTIHDDTIAWHSTFKQIWYWKERPAGRSIRATFRSGGETSLLASVPV